MLGEELVAQFPKPLRDLGALHEARRGPEADQKACDHLGIRRPETDPRRRPVVGENLDRVVLEDPARIRSELDFRRAQRGDETLFDGGGDYRGARVESAQWTNS